MWTLPPMTAFSDITENIAFPFEAAVSLELDQKAYPFLIIIIIPGKASIHLARQSARYASKSFDKK
jgi:hypothetical protein